MVAPDLQYVLDSAVEAGHISGGAHATLFLFASNEEIDAILEAPSNRPHWKGLMRKGIALEHYAQGVIAEMPLADAEALRSSSAVTILQKFNEYVEYAATKSFEDGAFGGFARDRHDRGFQGTRLSRKLRRRLYGPNWIDRQCKLFASEYEMQGQIEIWRINDRRFDFSHEAVTRVHQLYQEHGRRRQQAIDEFMRRMDPATVKERKVETRKRRRATVRAAVLAAGVLGASQVSAFARGEPIHIDAGNLIVEATKTSCVTGIGHGAMRVNLLEPDRTHISGLCVYQDLPVLDQLATLGLFAQAGQVDKVIDAGNLYNTAPNARTRLGMKEPERATVSMDDFQRCTADVKFRRGLELAYFEQTKRIWTERMAVHCYGRASRECLAGLEHLQTHEREASR